MFGSLDISASGMVAQRTRLEVASANIANKDAVEDASGRYNPYRRKEAILATGDGKSPGGWGTRVREVRSDPDALRRVLRPGHPHADRDGYLWVPDIEPAMEMVNAMEASRAYEANLAAAEATKAMLQASLRLLA